MNVTGMTHEKKMVIANVTPHNVYDFLLVTFKERLPTVFTRENDLAVYRETIRVNSSSQLKNGITIAINLVIEPKRPERPAQAYPNLNLMAFKVVQISSDRVMLYGGVSDHEQGKREFEKIWQIIAETYGIREQATQSKTTNPAQLQSTNIIADNLGGTITYTRNEQGQTIPTGGSVNPGYYVELGEGVAIRPYKTGGNYEKLRGLTEHAREKVSHGDEAESAMTNNPHKLYQISHLSPYKIEFLEKTLAGLPMKAARHIEFSNFVKLSDYPFGHVCYNIYDATETYAGCIIMEKHGENATTIIIRYQMKYESLFKNIELLWKQYIENDIEISSIIQAKHAMLPAESPGHMMEPTQAVLPEIEDPTDQRIWEWIKDDPSITDSEIGQRLGISRQAVNPRRRALEKMGYPVRRVSRQNQ